MKQHIRRFIAFALVFVLLCPAAGALSEDAEKKTIALFSHGGSSSAAIGHILSIQFPLTCALFHFGHTGITILRFSGEPGVPTVPCIELLNDMAHTTNIA